MPTAADLNNAIDVFASKTLLPIGFKRSGVHYFKRDGDRFYALIKDTARGYFMDYYLAFSHESAGPAFTGLLQKPSSMLKDYPVSVGVSDLEIIYSVNERLIDSPYYFYSLSREYKINCHCKEDRATWDDYFPKIIKRNELLTTDEGYIERYANELFSVISEEGLRFFNECDFELCYRAVQRPLAGKKLKQYLSFYKEYLDNFKNYCQLKNIGVPQSLDGPKAGWLNRLFGRN